MPLLHLQDAAKRSSRLGPGLLGREPAGHGVPFGQFKVRGHLVVELAIEPALADQREQPVERVPEAHALAPSTRATSALACSHCATSTLSWRAPALVSA